MRAIKTIIKHKNEEQFKLHYVILYKTHPTYVLILRCLFLLYKFISIPFQLAMFDTFTPDTTTLNAEGTWKVRAFLNSFVLIAQKIITQSTEHHD